MSDGNKNTVQSQKPPEGRVERIAREKEEFYQNLAKSGTELGKAAKAYNTLFSQPVQKGFSFAIESAAKVQTIGLKFSKVFGDMEESTKDWAENHATSIGKSVIDIQSYLSETYSLLEGMGMSKEESTEMSKRIVALGADYAAFHGKSDADAIKSLNMAIAGNVKEVEALGLKLNDTDFGEGFADLDENQKRLARYNAILKQTNEIQGYSQEVAGTFAGQMERLKASTEDLAAKFGEVMLPFLTIIVTKIGDLVNWFGELDGWAKVLILGVGVFVMALGPLLSILSSMMVIVGVIGAAAWWIFAIPAAIILIVAGISFLVKKFRELKEKIDGVGGFLKWISGSSKKDSIADDPYRVKTFGTLYKGTNYHPGGLALVGERGPELLSLPKGSRVATNYRTERILSNSSNATIDGSLQSNISSSSVNMPFAPQIVVNVEGREVNDSKTTLIKREVRDQILPMLEEYFSIMRLKHPILIER